MDKEELEYALDWALEWLENSENKMRIEDLIADIIADVGVAIGVAIEDNVYLRERIAKAIAMITDDVEKWLKEWR